MFGSSLKPNSQEELTKILIEEYVVKLTDSEIKLEDFKNFNLGLDLFMLDQRGVKIKEVNWKEEGSEEITVLSQCMRLTEEIGKLKFVSEEERLLLWSKEELEELEYAYEGYKGWYKKEKEKKIKELEKNEKK